MGLGDHTFVLCMFQALFAGSRKGSKSISIQPFGPILGRPPIDRVVPFYIVRRRENALLVDSDGQVHERREDQRSQATKDGRH